VNFKKVIGTVLGVMVIVAILVAAFPASRAWAQTGIERVKALYVERLDAYSNSSVYSAVSSRQDGTGKVYSGRNATDEIFSVNSSGDVVGAGDYTVGDDLGVVGSITADDVAVGGGYGATGCTLANTGALSCNDAIIAGGGYADTGCTLSAAGVLQCAGAATTDGALTAASGVFGGGFGATGCTLSATGALSCNDEVIVGGGAGDSGCTLSAAGALNCDSTGAFTGDLNGKANTTFGNGYAGTGATMSNLGVLQTKGAITSAGLVTADSVEIGGGHGATGCTISNLGGIECDAAVIGLAGVTVGDGYAGTGAQTSAAGVLQTKGAITTDSSITADSGVFGGGFGATGCTITNGGIMSCDDEVLVGGGYGFTGATLDENGNVSLDGTLTVDGTSDFQGVIGDSGGNLTINDSVDITGNADVTVVGDTTGGNARAKPEFIGLPRITIRGLGGGTNGGAAGKTARLDDDSPAGEFAAHDADTTVTTDNVYYREGSNSLKIEFSAAADAGDGAHDGGLNLDWTDDESVGMWMLCTTAGALNDITMELTDATGNSLIAFPAYTRVGAWDWIDLTTQITAVGNGNKDAITDISIELTAAGAVRAAAVPFSCYFDAMYKWDSTEEDALGIAVLRDGVLGIVGTTAGTNLVEYTDYFVHEEAGVDFVVWITDQSAALGLVAMVAY
jgi:hypothetical protein